MSKYDQFNFRLSLFLCFIASRSTLYKPVFANSVIINKCIPSSIILETNGLYCWVLGGRNGSCHVLCQLLFSVSIHNIRILTLQTAVYKLNIFFI